jgi:adenylyltransferase/sulfurtransferase
MWNPPNPPQPIRVSTSTDKPIRIPNLRQDRLGTFDFISWWEREKVQEAKVMIVGAGALGNEVAKNLALMGVGHLLILDFDVIEAANLSRSVLFRERDNARPKAEVAAARLRELNPDIQIQYLNSDVRTQVGLGLFRRMDAVISCLDNREARLAVNRFCYALNKPWVDGAIHEFLGLLRVFIPGDGACFECTLTEQARREISLRYSCPLMARANILLGKVPTTPTIASIIGAMQAQEALKLIHGFPVDAGKVVHFNGMTNQMHTTSYVRRDDCESHWNYGDIIELDKRAEDTTLMELLQIARGDLGSDAVLELDQELVLSLECRGCETSEVVMQPLSEVSFDAAHCPSCGHVRQVEMTHVIVGDEPFLHRTLANLGVPALHILRAHNGEIYRFYELSGDLVDSLHFDHFIRPEIKLGPEITLSGDLAPDSITVSITPNASRSSLPSLLEGVLVTSVLAIAIGLGALALYAFNRGIVPAVLVLAIAAGMGLITGLISRFELPNRSPLVRWWVAMFGLCVGMIPQGWVSRGILGLDLIKFDLIEPNLNGLLRLFLGAVSAWLAVRAWAGRPSLQTSAISQRRPLRNRIMRPTQMPSSVLSDVEAPPGEVITSPQRRSRSTSSRGRYGARRRHVSLRRPKSGSVVRKKRNAKRNQRRRIHSSIRLMESIEHRCPFCLELVESSDVRGKVECRICHTFHHADCWAVTGTCQVPHHNS